MPRVDIEDVIVRMVARVWYPVNFFRLSFGKQDKLSALVSLIREQTHLAADASVGEVLKRLEIELRTARQSPLSRKLGELKRYVPTRFLRPWYATQLKGLRESAVDATIAELSKDDPLCLYARRDGKLEMSLSWLPYISKHLRVLEEYALWNLLLFIQPKNPNTPALANKLFEPQARSLAAARKFWDHALQCFEVKCIYSGKIVSMESYSIDHFIPWSFVAHDQLWNLVPTSKEVNSSKSDNLPDIDSYLNSFASLQHRAFKEAFSRFSPKFLEDYTVVHPEGIASILTQSGDEFTCAVGKVISPLAQFAENMGYTRGWRYVA